MALFRVPGADVVSLLKTISPLTHGTVGVQAMNNSALKSWNGVAMFSIVSSGIIVAVHGVRFAWNMAIRGIKMQVRMRVGGGGALVEQSNAVQNVPSGIADDQFMMWAPARAAAGPPTFKDRCLTRFMAMQERMRYVHPDATVAA